MGNTGRGGGIRKPCSFSSFVLYYSIVMKQSKTEDLAGIFKALSNPQRLSLFLQICQWCTAQLKGKNQEYACCTQEVEGAFTKACDCMDISPSTISHHFKELQRAGLITCTRVGQQFNCRVNRDALEAVKTFIN